MKTEELIKEIEDIKSQVHRNTTNYEDMEICIKRLVKLFEVNILRKFENLESNVPN
jgi:hypothetical protein